jgi:hypothetical protein
LGYPNQALAQSKRRSSLQQQWYSQPNNAYKLTFEFRLMLLSQQLELVSHLTQPMLRQ